MVSHKRDVHAGEPHVGISGQGNLTSRMEAGVTEEKVRYTREDGQHGTAIFSAYPAIEGSGERNVLSIVKDQAQSRDDRRPLRESEKHLRTLFSAIDSAFCIIEVIFDDHGKPTDYRFLETNAVFEMHTGLRNAVGKTMRQLEPRHEDHWFDMYGDIAVTGVSRQFTQTAQYLDERSFKGKAFRIGAPAERKVAVMFNDITAQKNAEQALNNVNENLERIVAERTAQLEVLTSQLRSLANTLTETEQREHRRLAAIIHDDLQQLLVAARMKISALRLPDTDDSLIASRDSAIAILTEAIEEARSLTTQLRPPSLYESGLVSALRWLAGWTNEKFGLAVTLELDEEAEPHDELEAVSLFESVRELLLNIVKHAGVKEASIKLQNAADEGRLRLSVEDRGAGFDVSRMESRMGRESGFGLMGIRERMQAIHGSYQVRSALGAGAVITLTAPLGSTDSFSDEDDVSLSAERETSPGPVEESPTANRAAVKVLIADDHAMVRHGIAGIIERASDMIVIEQSPNGRAAVESASKLRPDVVVMDVNMPEMNGINATRALTEAAPDVKVIGLSVHSDAATRQAMLDAGAKDYLLKDGPPEKLIDTIRRLASQSDGSAGS